MKNACAVRSGSSVSRLSAVAMAAAAVAVVTPAFAADKAWSTAPGSNAFSGTNWTAGNVPGAATTTLASGDAIFFGTSAGAGLAPNNDISNLSLAGITFNAGASVFTIGGTPITLTGNITNNSTAFQTFNNAFNFSQATTTLTSNTGGMNIFGTINAGTGAIAKTGSGLLGLLAANNYSGGTSITGTLFVGNAGAVGTGPVTVNGTATGGAGSLSLGANLTFANNIVSNGGGFTGIGVIQMPDAGTSNLTGTITLSAAQNAGGTFSTGGSDRILRIVGDNTIISSSVPVSVRAGRVIYTGAQNYTTGTVFGTADARASVQFSKIVSMPAGGAVTVAQGNSIIVNAGGAGEFTSGAGTSTAGTIGGLLAGVGGQGAPVTWANGTTLGVDTTNATAPIVFNAPWTSTVGSVGLLKLGAGALELTAGGGFNNAGSASGGAAGFPLVVRQGTVRLNTGTYAVGGETVVGGNWGTSAGAAGFDATLELNNAAFTTGSWLSVGRGNGVGGVTSSLVANNSTLQSTDFSAGFNVAAANLPKVAITLNNSTYTHTGANFNLAESAGSTAALTLTGSSAINLTGTGSTVHFGQGGSATVVLNDTSSITANNNNANFFIGRQASGTTTMTLNGSSSLTHNGAAAGTIIGDGGSGLLNVNSPAAKVTARNLLIGHFGTTSGSVLNKGTLADLSDGIFMGDGNGSTSYLRNDNASALVANSNAGNIVAGIVANSSAVIDQVSGSLSGTRVGGGFFQTGATNAQYNVTGGTLTAGATGILVSDGAAGAKFVSFNVSGTGSLIANGPINLGNNADAGTVGVISLRTGGTVVADTINATNATGAAVINANGGTLRANAGIGTAANAVLVGTGVDSIQVTGAGLTVDTNGLAKSIDTVITDPQNQGITGVSLSGTGTGFIGRPLVKITDATGSGATAVADWDPATGQVTGITVTAPGSNYNQPVVTIFGNGGTPLTANATLDFSFGGGITKTGSGTLSLTAANSYTGATVVQGGTLRVKTNAAGGIAATPLLSTDPTTAGTDIRAGAVEFDYSGDTSPVSTIRGLLAGSFQNATTPGVMDSGQIRSSTATATKGLGYRDDGTGTILVKVALFGDADLDGGVSINDFNALAGNFGQSTGKVWVDGDFDYDGGVSINDFNLLAGGFGQSLPPTSEVWAGLLAFAAAHNDLVAFEAVTGVPEPTSLGLIAAGATLGLRRRRRAK